MAPSRRHSPRDAADPDCRWVRERLEARWGFDLLMAELVRVEDHLHQCPACAAAYEALRLRLEADVIAEFGLENMKPAAEMAREIIARDAAGEPPLASRWLSEDEIERMADEIEAEIEAAYAESPNNPSGLWDCGWVTERFGAYDQWDESLSVAEFAAVERHLYRCPPCAREYADIRAVRHAIEMAVAGLRDSGLFDREGAAAPESLPLTSPGADRPPASRRRGIHRGSKRWKRPLVLAASLLLAFALPVLAFVGVHHLRSLSASSESRVEAREEIARATQPPQPGGPKGDNALPGAAVDPNAGFSDAAPDISEPLDSVAEATIRDFELAALLPNTEEEYEAWAREEYPHIMALYDVLTEVDPTDSDAQLLWDGRPVNILAWGERLYAEAPEAARPEGWRALLIYSGEILKFDYPESLNEPNCIPTVDGLQRAAAVAGYGFIFPEPEFDVRVLDFANKVVLRNRLIRKSENATVHAWLPPIQDVPDSYIDVVTGNSELAHSTLIYLAVCGTTVQTRPFRNLAHDAEAVLSEIMNPRMPQCNAPFRRALFDNILENRKGLAKQITILRRR